MKLSYFLDTSSYGQNLTASVIMGATKDGLIKYLLNEEEFETIIRESEKNGELFRNTILEIVESYKINEEIKYDVHYVKLMKANDGEYIWNEVIALKLSPESFNDIEYMVLGMPTISKTEVYLDADEDGDKNGEG